MRKSMIILILLVPLIAGQNLYASNIEKLEYFIDTDPGFGQAIPVSITPGEIVSADFTADLSNVESGFHVLYIRAMQRDEENSEIWSLTNTHPFFRTDNGTDIVKMEYFIDTDPGYEKGVDIPITAGSSLIKDFTVDLSTAGFGFHVLYIRAKDNNGTWSLTNTHPFFRTENTEPTEMEYFIDTDPGYGKGVSIPVTAGTDITKDFSADLSSYDSDTDHILYVRVKGENGLWSDAEKVNFSVHEYSLSDVIAILNILADNPPSWWSAKNTELADKVKDGKADMKDVLSIMRYLLGL